MRNIIEIQTDLLAVEDDLAQKTVEINQLKTKKSELEKEFTALRKANFEEQVAQQKAAEEAAKKAEEATKDKNPEPKIIV